MGRIIAIGGGELSQGETYGIDKEIVRLSGRENPKILFVPTASYEPAGYCERFKKVYEEGLGGCVEVLYLLDNKLSLEEIEGKIRWADIIYVGGGDTRNMLKVWREKQVDRLLKEAYETDTVLCGLSAGAICWFEYGQSEIECDQSEDGYEYIILEGLGLIKGLHCPHFNEGRREEEFYRMIRETGYIGIGLENNCAIAIIDDKYKILTAQTDMKAYRIQEGDEKVEKQEIEQVLEWRKVSEIL